MDRIKEDELMKRAILRARNWRSLLPLSVLVVSVAATAACDFDPVYEPSEPATDDGCMTGGDSEQLDAGILSVQVDGINGAVVTTTSGPDGTSATQHNDGAVDVTFPNGMFGEAPTCVVSHAEPTDNIVTYHVLDADFSGISVLCRVTPNGSSNSQTCGQPIFNLICAGH